MATRPTPSNETSQARLGSAERETLLTQMWQLFSEKVVDGLRKRTGYNVRQRQATARRLLLTVVEAFLLGETLAFAPLRAIFVRRFGQIEKCPFHSRFKQAQAAEFFRQALHLAVMCIVNPPDLALSGPLRCFHDVLLYDATSQRLPPRGRAKMPSCAQAKAGAKTVVGYSIKPGRIDDAVCDAQKSADLPLWRSLVPTFVRDVLYMFDLGFFDLKMFTSARMDGAHVLMRLKSKVKVKVLGAMVHDKLVPLPGWSLSYYLQSASKKRGTLYDLDVVLGGGCNKVHMRLVGYAKASNQVRWYVTTVTRQMLTSREVVEAYRLRWHIELLFREIKQSSDLGRSFTADPNAVKALTYGALLGHVLARSIRIQAAISKQVPLSELRPLACLRTIKPYAQDIIDALTHSACSVFEQIVGIVSHTLIANARERAPSRSRPRIALELGAIGA